MTIRFRRLVSGLTLSSLALLAPMTLVTAYAASADGTGAGEDVLGSATGIYGWHLSKTAQETTEQVEPTSELTGTAEATPQPSATAESTITASTPVATPTAGSSSTRPLAGSEAAVVTASALTAIRCTAEGLLTQANSVTRIDLATGQASGAESLPVTVNGAGYNVLDGLVYVWDYDHSGVGRFGADNEYEFLGLPDGMPVANYNIGDVDKDGYLWLSTSAGSQAWYQIDVRQGSATFLQIINSGTATRPSTVGSSGVDWSYVPGHPGELYMVGRSRTVSTDALLLRFDMTSGSLSVVASLGSFTTTALNIGATYADADGFLYAQDNATGTIIRVDVTAGTAALFSIGPSSSVNDGAACAEASQSIDFADAPDSYRSSLAQNGARHSLLGWNAGSQTASLMLGSHVTTDQDARLVNADTDDALAATPSLVVNQSGSTRVTVTNDTDSQVLLAAWIDINGDGDFSGTGETLDAITIPAASGTTAVSLNLPAVAEVGSAWLRLRLYPSTGAGVSAYGSASGGEVEDWPVEVVEPAPALSLEKSASTDTVSAAGDAITYTLVATNAGNVTLHDVVVNDWGFSGSGGSGHLPSLTCDPQTVLDPGESRTCTVTYTVTQADIDSGGITNVASADSLDGSGESVHSPSDEVTVTAERAPALTIVKSALLPTVSAAGDTIDYSFEVTNTGNVTLTDVTVDDALSAPAGPALAVDCPDRTLAPSASMTCTATYTVTRADLDNGSIVNSATVTGTPPSGNPVTSDASTATVVAKTGDDGDGGNSGTLAYTGFDGGAIAFLAVAITAAGVALLIAGGRAHRRGRL